MYKSQECADQFRKPLTKNQIDRKPLIRVEQAKQQNNLIPKGMLSMNSSQQRGHEIQRNAKLTDTDSTDITHYNLSYSSMQSQGKMFQVEHLELASYKICQCKIVQPHSHKHCPFFHNAKDRKRPGNFYSAELCEYMENNQPCPFGDSCRKAHNRVEQLYRNDNYKTKFCTFYPNNIQNCEYGKFCSFAHFEEDISIELIHNLEYDDDFFMFYYKTVWCPFNLTQHDKSLCVYAHNWQDFRRKPNVFQYQPVACLNWKTTDFITEYSEGCPDSFNCLKCHGWKELEYHPMLFRTKMCLNQNCNKMDCSFFHSNQDKRISNINLNNNFKVFKIVPRNRIVKNTFKIRWEGINVSSNHNSQMLSQEIMKPMYLSQQHLDLPSQKQWRMNVESDWLGGGHNSSMQMDQSDDERVIKSYQNLLASRTNNECKIEEHDDNVRCVLNLIDE